VILGSSTAGWAQTPAPPPAAPAAAPNPATAKTYLAAGDKAAKAKDWAIAAAQYQASFDASPSAQALDGLAGAEYELKLAGEAYESYDRFLKDYAGAMGNTVKHRAETRLKELAALTGFISIRVNEAGADVSLDGKAIGQSPVAALIRVSAGAHKVDVSKAGFAAATKTPNVTANGKEIVDVQLAREATTGHLAVREKTGQPVRVLVDGADVGATPLDMEVAPGPHEVILRSSTLASPPQKVDVVRGQAVQVEVAAVAAAAHLEVTTSDRKGIIFFDGKPVAEGAYSADVTVGPHTLAVTREGFERYEKQIVLTDKQSLSETVTLKLPEATSSGSAAGERSFDGLYGGLGAFALFEPGGEGNEIDTGCTRLGAQSCATSAPVGGGLMGWVGWAWNPIGVELFLAGEGDQATPSATFIGGSALQNPLAVGNPHVEQFGFARVGGMGAVRVRASLQTDRIRGSLAAGAGFALKDFVFFGRDTKSNSGGENTYTDRSGHTYLSPAVSLDGSIALRLSPATAIALGLMMMFETAGSDVQSSPNGSQYIGGGQAPPAPLPTPAYHFATGAQTFIGPYLGLQFGP
jgi:hypothetical protein